MTNKGGMKDLKLILIDKFFSVHVPTVVGSMCQGVATPVIPIFARQMAASDATIGLITACIGLGRVLAAIPGGILTSHFGVRRIMVAGMLLTLLGTLICLLTTNNGMLAAAALTWGLSVGLFFIARHPFLAMVVEKSHRGRLMSMVGGGTRWAFVFGPTLAGALIDHYNVLVAIAAQVPLSIIATASLWFSTDVKTVNEKVSKNEEESRRVREEALKASGKEEPSQLHMLGKVLHDHGRLVGILGLFASTILGMRANRRMMLPLAALNMGLDATYVGLIVSISFVVDASFFFVGGMIMDTYGRKMAQLPTSASLGLAFFVLAFAHNGFTLLVAALLFGVAETTGSGILLTMIADHTPPDAGVTFMSFMRMVQDCGQLFWPLIIGALTTLFSFRFSCIFMGVVGIANTFWAYKMIPETHDAEAKKPAAAPSVPAKEEDTTALKDAVAVEMSPMHEEEDRHRAIEEELKLSICSAPPDET